MDVYSAISLKQQPADRQDAHYPDSESTRLCSYCLMLSVYRINSKYQSYILWVDPSPITYDFTFHVHILRFHWDFFIFCSK